MGYIKIVPSRIEYPKNIVDLKPSYKCFISPANVLGGDMDPTDIADLFDELEEMSDSGPEMDTMSISSTPKPSLRPFFSSSRSLAQQDTLPIAGETHSNLTKKPPLAHPPLQPQAVNTAPKPLFRGASQSAPNALRRFSLTLFHKHDEAESLPSRPHSQHGHRGKFCLSPF
jgi:hypothetical protein